MTSVELSHVTKSFTVAERTLPVLCDLSLSLDANAITVIVGKSGCGKTTLLRTLCGLETCDSGTITFPAGMRTGVVFQEPRLMPWLTTRKNITFGLKDVNNAEIQSLIQMVGLSGFESAYPDQLSGGMQQRTSLARALAHDSALILMDEPFAALDYFTRMQMQQELLRVQAAKQKGIVFVTHSIDEALTLGTHIIILSEGHAKKVYDLHDIAYPRDALSSQLIALKRDLLIHLN